jgi:hypothetical protein
MPFNSFVKLYIFRLKFCEVNNFLIFCTVIFAAYEKNRPYRMDPDCNAGWHGSGPSCAF